MTGRPGKLTVAERRDAIRELLARSTTPITASARGGRFRVTRQVIVNDIGVLRAQGVDIVATTGGYVCPQVSPHRRVIAVRHTPADVERELTTIVDYGGHVIDVTIDHPVYGTISAPIEVYSPSDLRRFLAAFAKGHALAELTDGYHRHTITAPSADALDRIEAALDACGILVHEDEPRHS